MQFERRSSLFAALSAAVLCFAATPAPAQGLVSVGSGSYSSPANPESVSRVSYYVTEHRHGAVRGYAVWTFPASTIVVRVTSFGFYELPYGTSTRTALAFAGPIVAVFGTPRGPNATVGRTAFAAFLDNGRRGPDETVGFSVAPLPSQVPPVPGIGDLTTIQQIAKLLPFFPPPVWASFLRGNVRIR